MLQGLLGAHSGHAIGLQACCCSLGSRAAQVYWLAKCHTPLASAIIYGRKAQSYNRKPQQPTRPSHAHPHYNHTPPQIPPHIATSSLHNHLIRGYATHLNPYCTILLHLPATRRRAASGTWRCAGGGEAAATAQGAGRMRGGHPRAGTLFRCGLALSAGLSEDYRTLGTMGWALLAVEALRARVPPPLAPRPPPHRVGR